MANGTTRNALAKLQLAGKQEGEHEAIKAVLSENSGKGPMKKIPLKNPTPHNHSK